MEEKITISSLNVYAVSIQKQNSVTIDGKEYFIGQPSTKAYVNSSEGRMQLKVEVVEPYYSLIISVWGDTPTITEVSQ